MTKRKTRRDPETAAERWSRITREVQTETDRRIREQAKPRSELIRIARMVGMDMFVGRKALSDSLVRKAEIKAFDAIRRYDRLTGLSNHPHAAYSHGIATLAHEGVAEAREAWMVRRIR